MPTNISKIAGASPQNPPMQHIVFWDGSGRLKYHVDDHVFTNPSNFNVLSNIQIIDGRIARRKGLTKLSSATPMIGAYSTYYKELKELPIGGITKLLGISSDYKLYNITLSGSYLIPGASIATLVGDTQIIPFNDKAILCDTSYLKYYNGTTVAIAYDDGTGTTGYLYNLLSNDQDGGIQLNVGGNTGVVMVKSTPNTGYSWPVTRISVWLKKVGTPTGAIIAYVWLSSTGAAIVTSTTSLDAGELTSNYVQYDFDFPTYMLANNTEYKFGFTVAGGDALGNHILCAYDTVASGGCVQTYDGAYSATDTTKNLCWGLKPGLPPKASFGCVADNRLYLVTSDQPGRIAICGPNDMFDWSTSSYAGYVNVIDNGASSFPVQGIISKWEDVYIFGGFYQPFIAKLAGTSPADWVVKTISSVGYVNNRRLICDIGNDVAFANNDGVYVLSGVEKYGDVESSCISKDIEWWIRTYMPGDSDSGLYFNDKTDELSLQFGTNVQLNLTLVCNTRNEFKWSYNVWPSDFYIMSAGKYSNHFVISMVNGHIYELSNTTDDGTAFTTELTSHWIHFPFFDMELVAAYIELGCYPTKTVTGTLEIAVNDSSSYSRTVSLTTVSVPQMIHQRINFKSIKLRWKITSATYAVDNYFGRIILAARQLYELGQR